MEENLILWTIEDNFNFFENRRRPQLFAKWKILIKGNRRQPQFLCKWKMTSILRLIEDDLNSKVN